MIRLFAICITIVMSTSFSLFAEVPSSSREAGLCTHHDDQSADVTWNFIQHFTYEKWYYTLAHNWTTSNNDYTWGVDGNDFSYFCGHGSPYSICMDAGDAVDLRNAGNNSNNGYGDYLGYLVLHSCSVVPSPIDVGDAFTPWLGEPGGIFDGLHVMMGFRTSASGSNDNMIASYMGQLTKNQSGRVWENWVNAVNTQGAAGIEDAFCLFVAFRPGYYDNPTYDAYYDVYGGSVCYDTNDPQAWCYWSE